MHLADTAFTQVECFTDLFHRHFFIVIEYDDQAFISAESLGNQTHDVFFLNAGCRIFAVVILDQVNLTDLF